MSTGKANVRLNGLSETVTVLKNFYSGSKQAHIVELLWANGSITQNKINDFEYFNHCSC